MSDGTIKPPHVGLHEQLSDVDARINHLVALGDAPAAVHQAHLAVAQVKASCALVHAVRELTEQVRLMRRGITS